MKSENTPAGMKMENHLILEKNKKRQKTKMILCIKTRRCKLLDCATPLKIGGWRVCWGLTDHIQSMYKVNTLSPEIK